MRRSRSIASHASAGAVGDRTARRAWPAARRRSSSVTPCVSGTSDGSPQRAARRADRVVRRQVAVAADRLGQVDGADDDLRVEGRGRGHRRSRVGRQLGVDAPALGRRQPRPEGRAGCGIHRRRVGLELLVQFQHQAGIHPLEVLPSPCPSSYARRAPARASGPECRGRAQHEGVERTRDRLLVGGVGLVFANRPRRSRHATAATCCPRS